MDQAVISSLQQELDALREQGLYKSERVITSPMTALVQVGGLREVINLCANNYLGLANHPRLIAAAQASYDTYGFGLASVRFICGTQDVHKRLEQRVSQFLRTEDTVLYSSCFDANGGLFETLLGPDDAVISDALNHASIIDGIRLCKAKRLRYLHNDMGDLEKQLKEAEGCRRKLIATDGVFSMDGTIANLSAICDLADKYGALVMVDDCHATGFLGASGRGSIEHCDVMERVDIITGTFGKALGGASGGFTSGRAKIIEWLRQRSRPYLFSNTMSPAIAAASIEALDLLEESNVLRKTLWENTRFFRNGLEELGFQLIPGDHPIIPVMLGDASLASNFAERMLAEGVYVIGFSYPVVPKGQARIRTQMSAAHTKEHLNEALHAFAKVGRELNVIT